MKKPVIFLFLILLCALMACGRNASDPTQTLAVYDDNISDPEREELENLRETPSVTKAVIENYLDGSRYDIDLNQAVVTVTTLRQEAETETYSLDSSQIDSLKRLLSEYALTVYEGNPYWPSGEYCTMIELFDFSINYDRGYYREYGATHYPEGWEDFIQHLKEQLLCDAD